MRFRELIRGSFGGGSGILVFFRFLPGLSAYFSFRTAGLSGIKHQTASSRGCGGREPIVRQKSADFGTSALFCILRTGDNYEIMAVTDVLKIINRKDE